MDVEKIVIAKIQEVAARDRISRDMKLEDDLAFDSLDAFDLVSRVKGVLGVEIVEAEWRKPGVTVGMVIDQVKAAFDKLERVLAIPTSNFAAVGKFQGTSTDVGRYLPLVLDKGLYQFLPRPLAEKDPTYKQLIPYVVLKFNDAVFHYTRGDGSAESRLRSKRSIGVGGHINPVDVSDHEPLLFAAMRREVEEEVVLEAKFRTRCIGFVNDDETPVGRVHLGVLQVYDLESPGVRHREKDLTMSGFAPISQLLAEKEQFEPWSQFALEALSSEV